VLRAAVAFGDPADVVSGREWSEAGVRVQHEAGTAGDASAASEASALRNGTSAAPHRPWRRAHVAIALVICAIAAGVAWLGAGVGFPDGGPIVDERVYRQQAIAIADGHLTLPASTSPAHTPRFAAPGPDGALVFKYTPVWAAALALSSTATGSQHPALALAAAGFLGSIIAVAALLARDPRVGLISGVVALLTPAFAVQQAMFLSYVPTLALALGGVAMLITGARRAAHPWLIGAGLLLGTAFFARPFETLLVGIPLGVYGLVEAGSVQRAARVAGMVAAGAAAPLLLMFAYHWAVLGSPLEHPFSVVSADDRFGFGPRRDLPTVATYRYGWSEAWAALGAGAREIVRWAPGGALGVALGLAGIALAERAARRALAGLLLVTPVGFLFFWGSWNAAVRLEAYRFAGPFYYLPTVVALVIGSGVLGVRAWEWARARHRTLAMSAAVGVIVVGLGASLFDLRSSIDLLRLHRREAAALQRSLDAAHPNSLVLTPEAFLVDRYNSYNQVPPGGSVVHALADHADWDLLERFAGRRLVRIDEPVLWDEPEAVPDYWDPLGFPRRVKPTELTITEGSQVTIATQVVNQLGTPVVAAYVRAGDGALQWILDQDSSAGDTYTATFVIGPDGVRVNGLPGEAQPELPPAREGHLAFGTYLADSADPSELDASWYEYRLLIARSAPEGRVRVVAPGVPWRRFSLVGNEVRSSATVDDVLSVRTVAGS
jgi:hypothetical protein